MSDAASAQFFLALMGCGCFVMATKPGESNYWVNGWVSAGVVFCLPGFVTLWIKALT